MTIQVTVSHDNETVAENLRVELWQGKSVVQSLPIGPGQKRSFHVYRGVELRVWEESKAVTDSEIK